MRCREARAPDEYCAKRCSDPRRTQTHKGIGLSEHRGTQFAIPRKSRAACPRSHTASALARVIGKLEERRWERCEPLRGTAPCAATPRAPAEETTAQHPYPSCCARFARHRESDSSAHVAAGSKATVAAAIVHLPWRSPNGRCRNCLLGPFPLGKRARCCSPLRATDQGSTKASRLPQPLLFSSL